ncbi:hypothetical protein AD006_09645 [Pseudonocardia sp. EC080610-09]|uniref:hypothetical protein n=1 Tax=unclassified Pseudonocardia TaxID=2619320 RepID=UPI0006CB49EF|nr:MULTISPECIES: hypothetical protein [unclassified Pseudonocardia]ALE72223.1 hypothetical protein FRP1_02025 [Pseudonocardia sp. EC080625-04]ALL75508.1 hypothetical protein AD006_09645 [Pseudonocardia sp. EC080610-09]ALL82534.1 hypothetical protein AD017_17475 [Pseudonocardia sp. EC080619-01]
MRPDPAVTGVDDQAAALRRLVERLDGTADVLAGVRAAVAWDDDAGREWTARLDLVQRAARRLADDVAAEAAEQDRAEAGAAGSAPAVPGIRLPGTAGIRTTDRRGVVAPMLPPMDGR